MIMREAGEVFIGGFPATVWFGHNYDGEKGYAITYGDGYDTDPRARPVYDTVDEALEALSIEEEPEDDWYK